MNNRISKTGIYLFSLIICNIILTPAIAESSSTEKEVEAVIRKYYDGIETMNYDAMRSLSTDEFEILDRGFRYGHYPFWDQVAEGAASGFKMTFHMQDFRTVVTDDVAYSTFVTIRPDYRYDGLDMIILKRVGGKWLVDRFVHLRMLDGTDPYRVPGGQKATWEGKRPPPPAAGK